MREDCACEVEGMLDNRQAQALPGFALFLPLS